MTDRTPELVSSVSRPDLRRAPAAAADGRARSRTGAAQTAEAPSGPPVRDARYQWCDGARRRPHHPLTRFCGERGGYDRHRATSSAPDSSTAMLAGWPTAEVLRFSNAAAAVSVTRLGAMAGAPSLAEVETLLEHGHPFLSLAPRLSKPPRFTTEHRGSKRRRAEDCPRAQAGLLRRQNAVVHGRERYAPTGTCGCP